MATRPLTAVVLAVAASLSLANCSPAFLGGVSSSNSRDASVASAQASHANLAPATVSPEDSVLLRKQSLIELSGPANNDGTLGSGCDVQEESELPDGVWFSFVQGVDLDAELASIDVACLFGTDSDQWEIYRDGLEPELTPARFVITNDVSLTIDVPIAADMEVFLAAHDWAPVTPAEALADGEVSLERRAAGLWVIIGEGEIVAVVEPQLDGAS
ncbi:hypothetical protein ON058_08350 [Demequina sp. B12]|uniref:hypothetical protein n=1 Tax=Demequina sp. B12 TaxID=2992757 RepID=UPI00237C477A|nr:hypothetical protein [Demequina sp. B12]MDE0573425.1 hypothetical protein [Demequina sp. B12]